MERKWVELAGNMWWLSPVCDHGGLTFMSLVFVLFFQEAVNQWESWWKLKFHDCVWYLLPGFYTTVNPWWEGELGRQGTCNKALCSFYLNVSRSWVRLSSLSVVHSPLKDKQKCSTKPCFHMNILLLPPNETPPLPQSKVLSKLGIRCTVTHFWWCSPAEINKNLGRMQTQKFVSQLM